MSSGPFSEEVHIALAVAREAAQLLLGAYRSRPLAREKGRADLVTEWDLKAEARIVERLGRLTPDIPVVAEERGGYATRDSIWYCDPLDGTTNYVHGHPCWAVSIGLLTAGEPVAGAVVAPALHLEWWGGTGGAVRCGVPCRVSETPSLSAALVATGFPPDRSDPEENNLAAFNVAIQHVQGVRRCGSAAIDCCFVADGTYDAYWERRLKPWDLAAGCAIALGAGGRLTALDGGPPRLAEGHVLLSNGRVHDALLPWVNRTCP